MSDEENITTSKGPDRPLMATKHFLSIDDFSTADISALLDLGDHYAALNRRTVKRADVLTGRTLVNLFFENSTRTQASFEIAGMRLGADVLNLPVATSSTVKGETLIDTAKTLDAMQPDFLVVRHSAARAPHEIAAHVSCAVLNAGDGANEHPTQGLLDALAMRRAFGRLEGLTVAICGDIRHSRVAGSNYRLLTKMGADVRFVGPEHLMPASGPLADAPQFADMREGLSGADVVMMLRIQIERMEETAGSMVMATKEKYFADWGLTADKLAWAKPEAKVMHPGPMNRGVEIDGALADDPDRSLVLTQVEMGVAARMAVLHALGTG
ncbi:MAG: aspartate carbamoyltransferase catalytic subunit [Pseudomonadota bacterium]